MFLLVEEGRDGPVEAARTRPGPGGTERAADPAARGPAREYGRARVGPAADGILR